MVKTLAPNTNFLFPFETKTIRPNFVIDPNIPDVTSFPKIKDAVNQQISPLKRVRSSARPFLEPTWRGK